VNRTFTQTIIVRCDDEAKLVELLEAWDLDQATTDIQGYMGTRLLADRHEPGVYVIVADFGVVDPAVPAADEAARNNERPETQAWAARLREVIEGEPEYHDFDVLYSTGL
jgi:hypothetical protein